MANHDVRTALDRVDPALGIFIDLDSDAVLREATANSNAAGRLAGEPVAVKDLIDTAHTRTTYGSKAFSDHVPDRDAAIVAQLRAEGAVIFGKTNLDEFAFGVTGYNSHFGPVLNPRDRRRTTGGSSSGSAAAVAAGICRLAVGTDTSGSVRIPAACCGIYGLKLSRGHAPMDGVHPLAESYDSLGFFGIDVADLQRLLGLSGLPDISTLRIGYIGTDLEIPAFPQEAHWTTFRDEVWHTHGDRFRADPASFGRNLQRQLNQEIGDVHSARQELAAWRERFLSAVSENDVLIGPVLDGAAPLVSAVEYDYDHAESRVRDRLVRHTPIYNHLGWAAMTVPTDAGPIQAAARPGDEAMVLAVGAHLGLAPADIIAS